MFSQYLETIEFICDQIKPFPHRIYTGQQSPEERNSILKNFKLQQGPSALLMSIRAGGVGLNIIEANTVVLFDRWWNPAVEAQAIERAHRFGRTLPLHVIRFLVRDTIEERIDQVLKDKQIDFDRFIEEAESADVPLLTRDDLRSILELSWVDTETIMK